MKAWTRRSRILCAAAVLLAAGVLACGSKTTAPVGAPITTVPASWKGVWQLHAQAKLCNTNFVLEDTTIVESLCPGDSIGLPSGLNLGLLCTNGSLSATASSIHFSCSQAFHDTCSGTLSVSLNLTINGSAGIITGSGRVNVDSNPNTLQCQDVCVDLVFSGTRLPNQVPNCTAAKPEWLGEIVPRRIWKLVR